MPNIKHVLMIASTPAKVYDAITIEAGIKSWWTTETIAKPEVGHINEQRFGDPYFNKMKVVALEPNTRVDWKCVDGDPEWIDTDLTFEIEKTEDGVTLRFYHRNWKDESEFYGFCNHHWGRFLDSIKAYCETGQGSPYSPA